MHLEFYAQEVYYADALDGDIINVSFQEYPDPEIDYSKESFELPPSVKGIFFSANREFPTCKTQVEWSDGIEDDGGALIKEVILTKSSLKMILKNNYSFNVSFETDDITYQKIKAFFNWVTTEKVVQENQQGQKACLVFCKVMQKTIQFFNPLHKSVRHSL